MSLIAPAQIGTLMIVSHVPFTMCESSLPPRLHAQSRADVAGQDMSITGSFRPGSREGSKSAPEATLGTTSDVMYCAAQHTVGIDMCHRRLVNGETVKTSVRSQSLHQH